MLIGRKKFTIIALDLEYKAFIIHIAILNIDLSDEMDPLEKAQIAYLKVNEALTKVFSKYIDFVDVFLPKLAVKLLKHLKINNYAIKLVND